MPKRKTQLRWLIALRLGAITSTIVPFALSLPGMRYSPPQPSYVFGMAGLTYLLSLIYIFLLETEATKYRAQASIQLLGDIVVITGFVYCFGGVGTTFSVLYLVAIAVASILLSRREAILLANLAWTAYATVALGLENGWIEPAGEYYSSSSFLFYQLAVHVVGFNAVALLVSYISDRAHQVESELEEAEADLAKLEDFHRNITNSVSSGLITTDANGKVMTVNPAGWKILDSQESEIVDQAIYEIGVCSEKQWLRIAKSTQVHGMQREEYRHTGGDKEICIGYSVTQLLERDENGRGYIVIFQDVTRWRQLEQDMRLNDRMAAIGELSAGIAHEIRNPLAAISGSVQMLSSTLSPTGPSAKLLDIIVSESRRLDRTIEGFLKFARPKEKSQVPFDIAAMLRENVELLENSDQVSKDHRVVLELDPPIAHIEGDRDHMSQIFWNLTRNALSAMPDGGTLEIRGEIVEKGYRIAVTDNGGGMTESQQQTMFQPFKTSFDGGSGLGMAIVYRLVQEHGGELFVESELGSGTTVALEIPIRSPDVDLKQANA